MNMAMNRNLLKCGLTAALTACGLGLGSYYYTTQQFAIRTPYAESSQLWNLTDTDDNLKLKSVIVFLRHGARTPMNRIPNVSEVDWIPEKLFNGIEEYLVDSKLVNLDGTERSKNKPVRASVRHGNAPLKGGAVGGMLTVQGAKQVYVVGEALRQRYVDQTHLLPGSYNINDIYMRSTNMPRTVNSLRALMSGLYTRQLPTVPIHVAEIHDEILFPNWYNCELLKQLWFQPTFATLLPKDSADSLDRICSKLGISENCYESLNFVKLRDVVFARLACGLPVPDELKNEIDAIYKGGVDELTPCLTGNHLPKEDMLKVLTVSIGLVFKEIANQLETAVKNDRCKKISIFSVHDTTILPQLVALDIFDQTWPRFGSTILYELYVDDKTKQHYVRVIYDFKERQLPEQKSVFVPYEKFLPILKKFVPDDFNAACDVKIKSLRTAKHLTHSSAVLVSGDEEDD